MPPLPSHGVVSVATLAAAFTAVLLSVTACGDGDDGYGEAALSTVRDSAGVRIVEYPPLDQRRPPEVTLTASGERESSVAIANRGGAEYSRISAADAGPDGRVYVLDGDAGHVVVLDPEGRVDRQFGRSGQGPGEFHTPSSLHVAADGSVVVGERMPWRLHRFAPDGSFLGSSTLRPEVDGGPDLETPPGPAMVEWGWPASGRVPARFMTLPVDPTRSPVNRLLRVHAEEGRVERVLLEWEEPGSLAVPPAIFTPRRSWTGDHRGWIHFTDGDAYEIRTLDDAGRVTRIVRRPVPARTVTREERERALRAYRSAMSRGGAPPELVERVAGGLRVAPVLPAIQEIWADRSTGELWVSVPRVDPEGGDLMAEEYHVYGPGGVFRGRAAAPAGFRLLAVRGRWLYGSVTDALDVPHLRIFRARLPAAGSLSGR